MTEAKNRDGVVHVMEEEMRAAGVGVFEAAPAAAAKTAETVKAPTKRKGK